MRRRKLYKVPIDGEFLFWLYKNHLDEYEKIIKLSKDFEDEKEINEKTT